MRRAVKYLGLTLFAMFFSQAVQAYYPYPAWPGYNAYRQPVPVRANQFGPYRPWPGYRHFGYVPVAYRNFHYNKPWGQVVGGVSPTGHFWVNIRLGGHFDDLKTLLTLMQMSGQFQSGAFSGNSLSPNGPRVSEQLLKALTQRQSL